MHKYVCIPPHSVFCPVPHFRVRHFLVDVQCDDQREGQQGVGWGAPEASTRSAALQSSTIVIEALNAEFVQPEASK